MQNRQLTFFVHHPRLGDEQIDAMARRLACFPFDILTLDLSGVQTTDTAALATLVSWRSRLLKSGRDLKLDGLHDRVRALYSVTRLEEVLPSK